jgi:hypothetical protein
MTPRYTHRQHATMNDWFPRPGDSKDNKGGYVKNPLKRSAAALIAFLIVAGLGTAEPNNTMRYLMNEPVHLLDLGIFQLETYLNSKNVDNFLKVDFDSDDEKLVIIFAYPQTAAWANTKNAENKFRSSKWQVQEHLGIDPLTCKFNKRPQKERPVYGNLNLFFRHQSNTQDQPDISGYEMYFRTKIRGIFQQKDGGILQCKADLLGTNVDCTASAGSGKNHK